MKPGAWDLRLVDHTPKHIRDAIGEKGYIVVTPTWFDIRGVSDANILSLARYAGVVQEKSSFGLSGDGLAALLGDGDGLGPVIGLITEDATLSTWITSALAASVSNGIVAGTLNDTGMSTFAHSLNLMTQRAAVDYICARLGAEWRVNPDGTLDAASPDLLFAQYTTPSTIVVRKEGGADYNVTGLKVDLLTESVNAAQWNSQVLLMGQGEGAAMLQEVATIGVNPYLGFDGGALNMARMVDSPSTEQLNMPDLAQASLNLYSTARREVSLSTDTYDIGRHVKPGDTIWVHDPDRDLFDTANKVEYRGATLTPKQQRVYSYRWPIQEGMGVFFRTGDGDYTDLTPYYERETGSTHYEIGAPTLPVDPDMIIASSMHGPKTNHAILERRSRGRDPVRVFKSGVQTITHNTVTALTYDSERYDLYGLHSTSSNTSRITITTSGYYLLGGFVTWASNAAGTRLVRVVLNGSGVLAGVQLEANGAAAAYEQSVTTGYFLSAGQYVELMVYQFSGGNLDVIGSEFWANKVA